MREQSEQGRVVALHLNVEHRAPMQPVDSITAVAGGGIEGDRHATVREDRLGYQVLLIDRETLESLDLAAGDVRENVTTAGTDLVSLAGGDKLALGSEVLLQISKPCAPCSRMDEIRPGLQRALEGRRGMLASVVSGGTVRVGDEIRVL